MIIIFPQALVCVSLSPSNKREHFLFVGLSLIYLIFPMEYKFHEDTDFAMFITGLLAQGLECKNVHP